MNVLDTEARKIIYEMSFSSHTQILCFFKHDWKCKIIYPVDIMTQEKVDLHQV